MGGIPKRHTGPSQADQQLIKLWDTVEAERRRGGERAALAMITKALAAVEPPKQEEPKQC
jgi:hypothetical protein